VSALWGPLISGAVVLVGGWLTYRQTTKAAAATNRVEAAKVDAAAYERARALYESGIQQLEEQLTRLRTQVNEERDVSNQLRNQVNALEETVARLRRQMILAGIDVGSTSSVGAAEA
jgi:chromosome segregation ATPase